MMNLRDSKGSGISTFMVSPQHLPRAAFLRMGFAESQGSAKGCLGF